MERCTRNRAPIIIVWGLDVSGTGGLETNFYSILLSYSKRIGVSIVTDILVCYFIFVFSRHLKKPRTSIFNTKYPCKGTVISQYGCVI